MNSISLAPLDIFFIVVMAFFVLRCIIRGFIAEFMAMIAIVGGIYAGMLFSSPLSKFLSNFTSGSRWTQSLAFLILFLGVYLAMKLLENIFHSFIEKINLHNLDKSLGLFWGILEGAAIVLIILFLLRMQPFFDYSKIVEGSRAAEIAENLFSVIPMIYECGKSGGSGV